MFVVYLESPAHKGKPSYRKLELCSNVYLTEEEAKDYLRRNLVARFPEQYLTYKEHSFYAYGKREVGSVVPITEDVGMPLLKKAASLSLVELSENWEPTAGVIVVTPEVCGTCALLRETEVCGIEFEACVRKNGPVFTPDSREQKYYRTCPRYTR